MDSADGATGAETAAQLAKARTIGAVGLAFVLHCLQRQYQVRALQRVLKKTDNPLGAAWDHWRQTLTDASHLMLAFCCAQAAAAEGRKPPQDASLQQLSAAQANAAKRRFVQQLPAVVLTMDDAMALLDEPGGSPGDAKEGGGGATPTKLKRRVYDIVAMLESLGVISRGDGMYDFDKRGKLVFRGFGALPAVVAALAGVERDQRFPLEAELDSIYEAAATGRMPVAVIASAKACAAKEVAAAKSRGRTGPMPAPVSLQPLPLQPLRLPLQPLPAGSLPAPVPVPLPLQTPTGPVTGPLPTAAASSASDEDGDEYGRLSAAMSGAAADEVDGGSCGLHERGAAAAEEETNPAVGTDDTGGTSGAPSSLALHLEMPPSGPIATDALTATTTSASLHDLTMLSPTPPLQGEVEETATSVVPSAAPFVGAAAAIPPPMSALLSSFGNAPASFFQQQAAACVQPGVFQPPPGAAAPQAQQPAEGGTGMNSPPAATCSTGTSVAATAGGPATYFSGAFLPPGVLLPPLSGQPAQAQAATQQHRLTYQSFQQQYSDLLNGAGAAQSGASVPPAALSSLPASAPLPSAALPTAPLSAWAQLPTQSGAVSVSTAGIGTSGAGGAQLQLPAVDMQQYAGLYNMANSIMGVVPPGLPPLPPLPVDTGAAALSPTQLQQQHQDLAQALAAASGGASFGLPHVYSAGNLCEAGGVSTSNASHGSQAQRALGARASGARTPTSPHGPSHSFSDADNVEGEADGSESEEEGSEERRDGLDAATPAAKAMPPRAARRAAAPTKSKRGGRRPKGGRVPLLTWRYMHTLITARADEDGAALTLTEIAQCFPRKADEPLRNLTRRLYDVANLLEGIHLVEKRMLRDDAEHDTIESPRIGHHSISYVWADVDLEMARDGGFELHQRLLRAFIAARGTVLFPAIPAALLVPLAGDAAKPTVAKLKAAEGAVDVIDAAVPAAGATGGRGRGRGRSGGRGGRGRGRGSGRGRGGRSGGRGGKKREPAKRQDTPQRTGSGADEAAATLLKISSVNDLVALAGEETMGDVSPAPAGLTRCGGSSTEIEAM